MSKKQIEQLSRMETLKNRHGSIRILSSTEYTLNIESHLCEKQKRKQIERFCIGNEENKKLKCDFKKRKENGTRKKKEEQTGKYYSYKEKKRVWR